MEGLPGRQARSSLGRSYLTAGPSCRNSAELLHKLDHCFAPDLLNGQVAEQLNEAIDRRLVSIDGFLGATLVLVQREVLSAPFLKYLR